MSCNHPNKMLSHLKQLKNHQLIHLAKSKSTEERRLNAELIQILAEIEKRRAYLKLGYSNLYAFVEKHLGYSGGSVWRRVNAAQAAVDLPEMPHKIEKGEISLTSASRLNQFFKAEKYQGRRSLKIEEKKKALQKITQQSERQVLQELAHLSTLPQAPVRYEERVLSKSETLIQFKVSEEFYQQIEEVKLLLSHRLPSMKTEDLFQHLVLQALKREGLGKLLQKPRTSRDTQSKKSTPRRGIDRSVNSVTTGVGTKTERPLAIDKKPIKLRRSLLKGEKAVRLSDIEVEKERSSAATRKTPTQRSRYIKAKDRRILLTQEAQGCAYRDPKTQKRCGERYQLQIDHCFPFSLGGSSELSNLQLLCGRHNRYKGDNLF